MVPKGMEYLMLVCLLLLKMLGMKQLNGYLILITFDLMILSGGFLQLHTERLTNLTS